MFNTALEYGIREYLPGDENRIVQLFNDENANLAGFVPRTVEYWRWCCLERPDVNEGGITVIENADRIVGYSVVGRSGNVWEICADSNYDKKIILGELLVRATDYAETIGNNSIVLNVPTEDAVLRRVCEEMNFAESPPEPEFLSVLDLPQLMCSILQSKDLPFQTREVFWFNLKNCPPWCVSSFGIAIEKQRVTVMSQPPSVSKITFVAELSTLISFIFSDKSALRAMASSKVQFSPIRRLRTARKLLNLVQIRTPWFIPRADMG